MELYDYQRLAVDEITSNLENDPVVNMPTGSGKSLVCAATAKELCDMSEEHRVLVLCPSPELVTQNHDAFNKLYPDCKHMTSVACAAVGSHDVSGQIVFGTIQTVYGKTVKPNLGRRDFVIIDEAHGVNEADDKTRYTSLLKFISNTNTPNEPTDTWSNVYRIGLTATPYRYGDVAIAYDGGLFGQMIEPVKIAKLVEDGKLVSPTVVATDIRYNLNNVKSNSLGEYDNADLTRAVGGSVHDAMINNIVSVFCGRNRKKLIAFGINVAHAKKIASSLKAKGLKAVVILGETDKQTRKQDIEAFKSGSYDAIVSVAALTTGFDAPSTDMIAIMRPTLSRALHVQMIGRGMRVADGKTDCLVMDFAGNCLRHGPIDAEVSLIKPGEKRKDGKSAAAAAKEENYVFCSACHHPNHRSKAACVKCGHTHKLSQDAKSGVIVSGAIKPNHKTSYGVGALTNKGLPRGGRWSKNLNGNNVFKDAAGQCLAVIMGGKACGGYHNGKLIYYNNTVKNAQGKSEPQYWDSTVESLKQHIMDQL